MLTGDGLISASTTDSPQEVQQAAEVFGEVESMEVIGGQPEEVETPASESAEPPEQEGGTEEAADESAGEAESPEDIQEPAPESGKKPGKKGRGVQQRISELTQERKAAEAERDTLKAQIEELNRKLEDAAKPKPPAAEPSTAVEQPLPAAKPEAAPEPKVEDFESYEAWVNAHTEWVVRQRTRDLEAKLERLESRLNTETAAQAQKTAAEEASGRWQGRVEKAKKDGKLPSDYEQAIEAIPDDFPLTGAVQTEVSEAENGPELFYYLATHLDEAKRLMDATALPAAPAETAPEADKQAWYARVRAVTRVAAREMGRISARLEASGTPETQNPKPKPRVSGAPAPIKPVAGGAAAAPSDDDEIDTEKFFEQERARLAAKNKRSN